MAQELMIDRSGHLYSWQEGKAELEFLLDIQGSVLPVEVKSGWMTYAKSLQSFVNRYQPDYRCVVSANNLL